MIIHCKISIAVIIARKYAETWGQLQVAIESNRNESESSNIDQFSTVANIVCKVELGMGATLL